MFVLPTHQSAAVPAVQAARDGDVHRLRVSRRWSSGGRAASRTACDAAAGSAVFQQNPSGPSAGGQQPTEPQGGLSLLLTALGMLTTGTGATNTLLLTVIGLKIFELIARKTPNKLDDQIAAFFRGIVDQGQNQSQTKQIL